jgi:AraC family transcriptional activator of pobA
MSKFDIDATLPDAYIPGRDMYRYFLKQDIDISKPIPTTEIIDLCRTYQRETGKVGMHISGLIGNSGATSSAEFTAPERYVFRPKFDIQINRHQNYVIVPMHAHEYFEFLITVTGSCSVFFGDQDVALSTGDLVMIPPFVAHTHPVFSDDCLMYSMSVRLSTVKQRFPQLFMSDHILSNFFGSTYDPSDKPGCLRLHAHEYFLGENRLADIVSEYANPSEYSCEMLDLYTSDFLMELLRNYSSDAEKLFFTSSHSQLETLVTQYIREHPHTVTMSDLSRKFSYSERQISRLIRQNTGMNYSQLLKKIRMESIGELVRDPSVSMEQIISDSGISSPSYFYKAFHAYFGMTPRLYRELNSAPSQKGDERKEQVRQ